MMGVIYLLLQPWTRCLDTVQLGEVLNPTGCQGIDIAKIHNLVLMIMQPVHKQPIGRRVPSNTTEQLTGLI